MLWRQMISIVALPVALGTAGCEQRIDPARQQARMDRAMAKVADEVGRRLGIGCAMDHETPNAGETRNFFCGREVGKGDVVGVGAGSERATRRRPPGWVERQPSTFGSDGRDYVIIAQTSDGLFNIKVSYRDLPSGKQRSSLPPAELVLKQALTTYEHDRE